MTNITERENNNAIKKLKEGLNTSFDIFLYGDKKSGTKPGGKETKPGGKGTKPGNILVYGTIAGQREVLKGRLKLQEEIMGRDEGNEK